MSSASDALPGKIAPVIFGCDGYYLSDDERAFFRDASPAGFILFKKNCDNPDQVRKLTADMRSCVGWDAPVLIDQEGGRVQRLRAPHWPDMPSARSFEKLPSTQGLTANVQALAAVQTSLGVDVNCYPVLDVVPADNTAIAIDSRAFSSDPKRVAELGLHACRVALESGMTPVMKHMPGHGRAVVDSHVELPRVDASADVLDASDWMPFRHVAQNMPKHSVWGMTAHVIYTQIDADLPGTISPTIIGDVIRKRIGFEGLLLSDDLYIMDALKPFGDVPERIRLALAAGVDIALPCHGDVREKVLFAAAAGAMRPETRARLAGWMDSRPVPKPLKPVETLLSEVTQALMA